MPRNFRPAGVEFRPPVKLGDFYAEDLREGDSVLVVDGLYQQTAPLRHKEILSAIDAGVRVIGAGSIGALRAAELHEFGMIGVGRVFNGYRSGHFVDDSEVSLVHSASDPAKALTRALVSIDTAASDLSQRGELTSAEEIFVREVARDIHFTERTDRALRAAVEESSLSKALESVLDYVDQFDVKRMDAARGMEYLQTLAKKEPNRLSRPYASAFDTRTRLNFARWQGTDFTADQVLRTLQIALPDFGGRYLDYVTAVSGAGEIVSDIEVSLAGWRLTEESPSSRGWSHAQRILARTFRLPPGNLTFMDVPEEIVRGLDVAEVCQLISLCRGLDDGTAVSRADIQDWLWKIWGCDSERAFEVEAYDRGFLEVSEALRHASAMNPRVLCRIATSSSWRQK
ncbi:TfuA-like protein [Rathayibacter tritici]|nr:TfuA-like protein [Rathayibacter tritici]